MKTSFRACLALLVLNCVTLAADESNAGSRPGGVAGFVLESAGIEQGLCLNLNDADGQLTVALAKASRLCVQGCRWDAQAFQAGRQAVVAAAWKRVSGRWTATVTAILAATRWVAQRSSEGWTRTEMEL